MSHIILANGAPEEEQAWEPESQTIQLLEACLKLAKDKKVSSVALVMIPTLGEYQCTAAGPDVDGMLAGSKELVKQLQKIIKKSTLILPQ